MCSKNDYPGYRDWIKQRRDKLEQDLLAEQVANLSID